MSRVLHIARREWLEQRRQPAMLGIVAATFLLIGGLAVLGLGLLQWMSAQPGGAAMLTQMTGDDNGSAADALRSLADGVVSIANWLQFTQFLGICAVLAGHSMLHDRQSNTLPFLLLAPVSRTELLLGKVLGAMGPAMAIYLSISGVTAIVMAALPITANQAAVLPPSPAWLVSFLLGGPVWALTLGTVCAIISSVSRDVRTAQQAVWFLVLFASFGCGFMLSVLLSEGALVQLAVAGTGLVCGASALTAGTLIVSRDLGR